LNRLNEETTKLFLKLSTSNRPLRQGSGWWIPIAVVLEPRPACCQNESRRDLANVLEEGRPYRRVSSDEIFDYASIVEEGRILERLQERRDPIRDP
jgi:hypothetical protein